MFIPVLILRNQIFSVFVVTLSSYPTAQIASCGAVLIIYTIYSLIYCPYQPLLRVCIHLSDVVFVAQFVILFLVTQVSYGS